MPSKVSGWSWSVKPKTVAVVDDRSIHDLPPGEARVAPVAGALVFGRTTAIFMDLPRLSEDVPAHRPLLAAWAKPWPSRIAIYRSPTTDGFELLRKWRRRAIIGTLAEALGAGPTSRFDLANALVVGLQGGKVTSVSDTALFLGANAFALETAADTWEIVQAGTAELVADGRYRLTRILRGQRGTERAMAPSVDAGARVVMLREQLVPMPIKRSEIGLEWTWRVGPAKQPVGSDTYAQRVFTPGGEGLRPFTVVHIEQPWRIGRTPGDYTIRWTRRDRSLDAISFDAAATPMSEESEAYEADILDGATVKQTVSSTGPSARYSGAPPDGPPELTPRVAARLHRP